MPLSRWLGGGRPAILGDPLLLPRWRRELPSSEFTLLALQESSSEERDLSTCWVPKPIALLPSFRGGGGRSKQSSSGSLPQCPSLACAQLRLQRVEAYSCTVRNWGPSVSDSAGPQASGQRTPSVRWAVRLAGERTSEEVIPQLSSSPSLPVTFTTGSS